MKGGAIQRRELVRLLEERGFLSKGGTKHEKSACGEVAVLVPRHREIPDQVAKRILRDSGLR